VTNGAAGAQRAKVERFALSHRFDHIQIEGEHGFRQAGRARLSARHADAGVTASETWMIGDNLEWEVVAPQRLGIYAIWIDVHGDGLPADSTVRPDRIIRSLTELLLCPAACVASTALRSPKLPPMRQGRSSVPQRCVIITSRRDDGGVEDRGVDMHRHALDERLWRGTRRESRSRRSAAQRPAPAR
jgi:hypothetical protein